MEVHEAAAWNGGKMRESSVLLLILASVVAPRPAPGQAVTDLAAQVRAQETAFAATMAERDLESFLSFVSEEAVFFTGKVLRGIPRDLHGCVPVSGRPGCTYRDW
jgi:hypothetical protein